MTRDFLEQERTSDPRAFEREYLAFFQDSISGFLPPQLVTAAVTPGVLERPYSDRWYYVAAIDPAFRRDAFGFTIFHVEDGTFVQDVVRRYLGNPANPLSPDSVISELAPLARKYHVRVLYSDQYHLESLQSLMLKEKLAIVGVNFTAKSKAQIYGNLQQLVLQQRLKLLDDHETIRELKALERTLSDGGSVQIGAPAGFHDDMATVVALAASQAKAIVGDRRPPPPAEPTVHDRILEQIRRQSGREDLSLWD